MTYPAGKVPNFTHSLRVVVTKTIAASPNGDAPVTSDISALNYTHVSNSFYFLAILT